MLKTVLCQWLPICAAAAWLPQLAVGNAASSSPDKAEPASFIREVRYLDADHDRAINAQELARGQQMAAVLLSLSWEDCDHDGDGVISPAEFESAVAAASQALAEDEEKDSQAEEKLFDTLSPGLLLAQLAENQEYAEELAALRAAVEDLDDDEAVVTHIIQNPKLYPRLSPVVHTYVRHYPLRPAWRPHVKARHPYRYKHPYAPKLKPKVGPKPPMAKARGSVKAKVGPKPVRKPAGKPKPGGRGRP